MPTWKPTRLASPHARPARPATGATRCAPRSSCPGCRRARQGKVILANGFNWLRYRVRFENGAEVADLDGRHLEPTGRAARRLAKRQGR